MEITYVVRNLQLFTAIDCSDGDEKKNGKLYNCKTSVTEKDLEPERNAYIMLNEADMNTLIPQGTYLFVQGVLFPKDDGFPVVKEVRDAAEQLWLEFLWEEKKPVDDKIYLRVLDEEDHAGPSGAPHAFIFQLMRGVA